MSKFLLTLAEYNRIHQVIHGTIQKEAQVEKACTFFAIFGSLILNQKFGIGANPVAGAFALCVDPAPKCMYYGKDEGGKIGWDEDGFHMWVQTETHIIDFMAPIYEEAFAEVSSGTSIPRKMFQKPISEEAENLDALIHPGDFMTFPDPELSETILDHFLSRVTNKDLLMCAEQWYGSRRGRQRPSITLGSNDNQVHHLTLPTTIARSPW